MLLIVSILTAILIGLIVYILRKDQQRRYADIVNQGQHLPPIDLREQIEDITALDEPVIESDPVFIIPMQTPESAPVLPVTQSFNKQGHEQDKTPWKERCMSYRRNNQFEQALATAQEAWPQWQSYEQTAITLRALIKTHPDLNEAERTLRQLYRIAAEASYLYDRPSDQPSPRWQTIAQSTTRQHLDQQSYSWQHLGYLHLKLLNQTDIKNMTKLWGEPGQHLVPLLPGAAKSVILDL